MAPKINKMAPKINKMAPKINKMAPIQKIKKSRIFLQALHDLNHVDLQYGDHDDHNYGDLDWGDHGHHGGVSKVIFDRYSIMQISHF